MSFRPGVIRKPPAGASRAPAPPGRKPAVGGGRVGTGAKTADDGYLYVAGVKDKSNRIAEYRTDQDKCPICKTDRQFNKNLRLLVSPCYHKMCESCIDRLFTLGPEPCPQCGKILRKVNFAHQTFEDLRVEKEVSVRKRIGDLFNKRQDDFATMREWNDYLELVEDITFNLLNENDIEKTESQIAKYARQNSQLITANKQKAAFDAIAEAEREEVERQARIERRRMVEEYEKVEEVEKAKMEQAVMEAMGRGQNQRVADLQQRYEIAFSARSAALDKAVPPALLAHYNRQSTSASAANSNGDPAQSTEHISPLAPTYSGVYVPIPYSDPETAAWRGWYTLKKEKDHVHYLDWRHGVASVRQDEGGRFGAGGYDLGMFWEMEIRTAVEGLGVEPL